ncbi:unnamed protein product [Cuscuta campestris]|uniref:F-box associated domain-containing protein n=1 Tax=Cuscuta campestris TaxID=132261 RepID=A0A484KCK3_9ASTE|nr:unnamed protein product [Cuscuta campestris]
MSPCVDDLKLWMMKEYGVVESWCRLHRIELVEGMGRIVGFRENSELVSYQIQNSLINLEFAHLFKGGGCGDRCGDGGGENLCEHISLNLSFIHFR